MRKKNRKIAFITPNILGEYYLDQWYAIEELTGKWKHRNIILTPLMFFSERENRSHHKSLFSIIEKESVDGIIFSGSSFQLFFKDQEIDEILKSFTGIPLVTLSYRSDFTSTTVSVDNASAIKKMTEHLIRDHKYKNIGFIRGPLTNNEAQIRYNAFLEIMRENKLPVKDNWILNGDFGPSTGESLTRKLLFSRAKKPQVLMAANDAMAAGAIKAVEELGLKVGRDIAITGFDNIATSTDLGLTTVSQSIYKHLDKSLELLFKKTEGKKTPEEVSISSELIIRKSCGCTKRNRKISSNAEDIKNVLKLHRGFTLGALNNYGKKNSNTIKVATIKKNTSEIMEELQIPAGIIYLYDKGRPRFNIKNREDMKGKIFLNHSLYPQKDYLNKGKTLFDKLIQFNTKEKNQATLITPLIFRNEHYGLMSLELPLLDALFVNMIKNELESGLHNIHTHKELSNSMKSLQSLLNENRHLLNVLAHDIKGPLHQVNVALEMIRDPGPLNERQEMLSKAAQNSIKNCDMLITDLLKLQRYRLNSGCIKKEEINIREFLGMLIQEQELKAREKKQKLKSGIQLKSDIILSNQEMLRSVLTNLLTNALKFSPAGKSIYFSTEEKDESIVFVIQDSGPGFTDDDLGKLYQPFSVLSAEPTGDESSTGLGLSLVKTIVEMLGGEINLETKVGKGSTFTIEIPF